MGRGSGNAAKGVYSEACGRGRFAGDLIEVLARWITLSAQLKQFVAVGV